MCVCVCVRRGADVRIFLCGHTLKPCSLRELKNNSLRPHGLKAYPHEKKNEGVQMFYVNLVKYTIIKQLMK